MTIAPSALAAGPPRTSSLSWTRLRGAETCIGARAVAKAVEDRLGRAAFVSPARAEISIEGWIERTASPAGWRAMITVADEHGAPIGTRELVSDAARCDALDEEITLVVALMIDPDAALLTPPPPAPVPAPAPVPVPVPVPCPAPPPPPRPPPPPQPSWRAGLRAGLVTSLGLLPEAAFGFESRASFAPPRWPSFELGAALWAGQTAASPHASQGATLSLAAGTAAVCANVMSRSSLDLSGCLGAQIGALRAGGFGFDVTLMQEQPVFNASAESRASLHVAGPLVATVGASVLVPVVRDRFVFADTTGNDVSIFQMAAVAGSLSLSLGVELR